VIFAVQLAAMANLRIWCLFLELADPTPFRKLQKKWLYAHALIAVTRRESGPPGRLEHTLLATAWSSGALELQPEDRHHYHQS